MTTVSARAAHLVLWGFLLANLVIVEVMFAGGGPPAGNAAGQAGRWLGLHLALVLVLQLVLISRLPFLDLRIGMDRLTNWHRWNGFLLFWLVLSHPVFVVLGFAASGHVTFLGTALDLAKQMPVLLGMIAAGLVVVVAATSVRALRRRLPYEVWHTVHLLVYAVVVLGIVHQVHEGTAFRANLFTELYWWGWWAFAIGALLTGRVIVPLVRNARHRLRVAAVVPESDDVVSVYVTGRRLDRLNARPGQFFRWRFAGHHRWWQANPFSLSAAPDGRSLRLTVKGVGRASRGLRQVPVGTRVFAEGPYGAFTAARRTREATLLIAGGIGVTPIRALLEDESLTGDIVVIYRVPDPAGAVLLGEIKNLAAVRGARLHVLAGRTGAGSPPFQPFRPADLYGLVPDITARDVYVCGPAAMTATVLRSLRALGVPARQRHAEKFSLAG